MVIQIFNMVGPCLPTKVTTGYECYITVAFLPTVIDVKVRVAIPVEVKMRVERSLGCILRNLELSFPQICGGSS